MQKESFFPNTNRSLDDRWICRRIFNSSMGQFTKAITPPASDPAIQTVLSVGGEPPVGVRRFRKSPLAVNKTALLL